LIRQKKADYVVTLKSNHPTLYNQVKTWFEMAKAQKFEGIEVSQDSRTKKGHHRVEIRQDLRTTTRYSVPGLEIPIG